jgi:hypothetical protein
VCEQTTSLGALLRGVNGDRVGVCTCVASAFYEQLFHRRKAAVTSYIDTDADAFEVCVRTHIVSGRISELVEAACYHQSCSVLKKGQDIIATSNSFEHTGIEQLHRPPRNMLSA